MNENQLQQNAQLISQLLQQSVAQDQTIRRNAEKHLLQFQKLPGFCFILTVCYFSLIIFVFLLRFQTF
jgi:hypothetical protein